MGEKENIGQSEQFQGGFGFQIILKYKQLGHLFTTFNAAEAVSNGRWGLDSCLPVGFWVLRATFQVSDTS